MLHRSIERETELALRLEPNGVETVAGMAKPLEHAEEVRPDKMLQHEAVVQGRPHRTSGPDCGSRQNQAITARISNCCARLMRPSGGISNERNSTSPRRPVELSGEYNLSMHISARCVLPVASTSRLRKSRSTSHG